MTDSLPMFASNDYRLGNFAGFGLSTVVIVFSPRPRYRKINSTILSSDDIVTGVNHRIKVVDAPRADSDRISSATVKMKALDDLREERKVRFPFLHIKRKLVG